MGDAPLTRAACGLLAEGLRTTPYGFRGHQPPLEQDHIRAG